MTSTTTNTVRTLAEVTIYTQSSAYNSMTNDPGACDFLIDTTNKSILETLDEVVEAQGNNFEGKKVAPNLSSLGVGDIIKVGDEYYGVAGGCSFIKITQGIYFAWRATERREREWLIRDIAECEVVRG